MTSTATDISPNLRPAPQTSRIRTWIALTATAVILALVVFGLVPFTYAAPLVGVVLALGTSPDYVGEPRPVARRLRNAVLGVALVAALAVVVLQPQLTMLLVVLVGMEFSGLVVTVVAVIALALPLAMADEPSEESAAGCSCSLGAT